LGSLLPVIDAILDWDRASPVKQRHTAKKPRLLQILRLSCVGCSPLEQPQSPQTHATKLLCRKVSGIELQDMMAARCSGDQYDGFTIEKWG